MPGIRRLSPMPQVASSAEAARPHTCTALRLGCRCRDMMGSWRRAAIFATSRRFDGITKQVGGRGARACPPGPHEHSSASFHISSEHSTLLVHREGRVKKAHSFLKWAGIVLAAGLLLLPIKNQNVTARGKRLLHIKRPPQLPPKKHSSPSMTCPGSDRRRKAKAPARLPSPNDSPPGWSIPRRASAISPSSVPATRSAPST